MNIRNTPIVKAIVLASLVFSTGLLHAQSGYSGGEISGFGSAVKRVILEQRFSFSKSTTFEDVLSVFPGADSAPWSYSITLDDETLAPFSTLDIPFRKIDRVDSFEVSTDIIRSSDQDGAVLKLFTELKTSITEMMGLPFSESLDGFQGWQGLTSLSRTHTKLIAGWRNKRG